MTKAIREQRTARPIWTGTLAPVCAVLALLAVPTVGQADPNILVILIDDLGIEHVRAYDVRGPLAAYAPLTKLDIRLAGTENWVRFGRAWSNPFCSPTRATFLAGLYGKETGIGDLVDWDDSYVLDTNDVHLLAKELQADLYETAIFGKWHLGGQDNVEMIEAGFDYFEGTLLGPNESIPGANNPPYEDYRWTISDASGTNTERYCRVAPLTPHDCDHVISDTYLTKDTVQAAIKWIQDPLRAEPWFVYLALQAPHKPWLCPPDDAYIGAEFPACALGSLDDIDEYYGMLQVVDEQIDRLLNIEEINLGESGNTHAFILSDNGSPPEVVVDPPIKNDRAKGSVFEGGVRVPFFAGGIDFADGDVADDLFINVSDVYATILDLAGLSNPRPNSWEVNQSQSFETYLMDVTALRVRDCIYTEFFQPNGIPGSTGMDTYNRATAGVVPTGGADVFKYVQLLMGAQTGLFNLSAFDGEWENDNLCAGGCSPTEEQIISELVACRDQFYEGCNLADIGEDCEYNSDCCPQLFCESQSKTCAISL